MPRARRDEDIFGDSTMTFGQHLEELRKCLFRAVLGLLAGLILGFFVGGRVVEVIQAPLVDALKVHVTRGSLARIDQELKELEAAKFSLPWSQDKVDQTVKDAPVVPEMIWVPREFPGKKPPEAAGEAKPKTETAPDPSTEEPAESTTANNEFDNLRAQGLEPFLCFRLLKDDPRISVRAFNAHEGFMIWLKASLLVGVVLAGPWIFYQLWSFIAAGLYPHEKRYVNIYLPFSILLFIFGVLVAFFGAFPLILNFLLGFNKSLGIEIDPRISEWLSFVLMLPLGFGIAFQLPLVMLFLERIGVCTVRIYLSYWRVAVLVIFVIAALLTPPDPWSMSLLAVPLTFLYFGGILLCKWMPRGKGLLPVEE